MRKKLGLWRGKNLRVEARKFSKITKNEGKIKCLVHIPVHLSNTKLKI
jgi:hypothetical protein